jgi:hypothetical protein
MQIHLRHLSVDKYQRGTNIIFEEVCMSMAEQGTHEFKEAERTVPVMLHRSHQIEFKS